MELDPKIVIISIVLTLIGISSGFVTASYFAEIDKNDMENKHNVIVNNLEKISTLLTEKQFQSLSKEVRMFIISTYPDFEPYYTPPDTNTPVSSEIETKLIGPIPYSSFEHNSPAEFQYLMSNGKLTVVGHNSTELDTDYVKLINTTYQTQPNGKTDSVDVKKNAKSFVSKYRQSPTFQFFPDIDGNYPTHVGIVFTDIECALGTATTILTFIAEDPLSGDLPKIGPFSVGGGNDNPGSSDEDRFFGVINAGGISQISFTSKDNCDANNMLLEFDHLQYGRK